MRNALIFAPSKPSVSRLTTLTTAFAKCLARVTRTHNLDSKRPRTPRQRSVLVITEWFWVPIVTVGTDRVPFSILIRISRTRKLNVVTYVSQTHSALHGTTRNRERSSPPKTGATLTNTVVSATAPRLVVTETWLGGLILRLILWTTPSSLNYMRFPANGVVWTLTNSASRSLVLS